MKDPSVSLHYLVKCQCLQATIENKTLVTGVAGLSASSSKADKLNCDVKTAGCESYFKQ